MNVPEPLVRVVAYEVSCVPEDHPDASLFTVDVEYRGDGRWAVKRSGAVYDADGNRSWGMQWEDGREPVGETEMASHEAARLEWLGRHRFDEKTALELARTVARVIEYRGYTIADALARYEPAAPAVQDATDAGGEGSTSTEADDV